MKRILVTLVVVLSLSGAAMASSYYKVLLTRIESNLYQDKNSGVYILTSMCYKYAYSEEAVLKWDGGFLGGELIFDDGSKFTVKKLLVEAKL